jgi:4-cresol dehydrogenase (hydroxylating) flavoprotein subunit
MSDASMQREHSGVADRMQDVAGAVAGWRRALGTSEVVTDAAALRETERATFATRARVHAIVRPASTAEVQACLRIASDFRVPVYPVSGGKNWGYGSRVPVHSAAILDLRRMASIVAFSERLGYATVEPGVTFRQLYRFLRRRRSRLDINVTSASPDASLIGNALERGIGWGPHWDRCAHVCGLEVVLANGEIVRTGFSRFDGTTVAPLHRWGLGPALDGLFSQSNLGIVTRLTTWLTRQPASYDRFYVDIAHRRELPRLVDALQELLMRGTVRLPIKLVNDCRSIASQTQYPWARARDRTPLPARQRQALRREWGDFAWRAQGMLHYQSRGEAPLAREAVTSVLRGRADSLLFVSDRKVRAMLNETDPSAPTANDLPVAYWRKRNRKPTQDLDLDRDRCGLIWCAIAVPFEGREVGRAVAIVEESFTEHGFEPLMTLSCSSPRHVDLMAPLVFDRDREGDDAKAAQCYETTLDRMHASGFPPFRVPTIATRENLGQTEGNATLLRAIKSAVDPMGILAPGRYEPAAGSAELPARR